MEYTTEMSEDFTYKGQPLRMSYKGQEYRVHLLQKGLRKEDDEIKVLLDGKVSLLRVVDGKWSFAGRSENQALAQEIYRAISLRYRI